MNLNINNDFWEKSAIIQNYKDNSDIQVYKLQDYEFFIYGYPYYLDSGKWFNINDLAHNYTNNNKYNFLKEIRNSLLYVWHSTVYADSPGLNARFMDYEIAE